MFLLILPLQITSFADSNSTQTTNSTQIIDQYLDSINNSTSQIILPIGNATLSTENQIEIGQTVKWTQVITLNDTADSIAVEIPYDALILKIIIEDENTQINIVDENQISTDKSISILDVSETEIIIESFVNSTAVIDNQESLLVELESVEFSDESNTKLIILSDENNIEEIQIEYETAAAYAIEDESDEPDYYNKTVTVKSDSAIHYENVRSYSDIPEKYVLLGIPFTLDWIINGTTVNVIDDARFDVNFEDTNDNGLVDQMSWIISQLSEKTFSINADTGGADDVSDVSSKLQQMDAKLDGLFYDKTLEMVNAKVMGKLDEYLIEDRNLNGTTADVDSLEYYDVIILPNLDGWNEGNDVKEIIKQNQQKIKQNLETKHNARNVFTAERLSFVTAQILVSEIRKLSEYGHIRIVGDGELKLELLGHDDNHNDDDPYFEDLYQAKEMINANNLLYDGTGVSVTIFDTGIYEHHPDLEDKITHEARCTVTPCNTNVETESIHGTRQAGIIAGSGYSNSLMRGVSHNVDLFDLYGLSTFQNRINHLAYALEYSFQQGANVFNISLGSLTCNESITVDLLVDESIDEGMVIVSGVGNGDAVSVVEYTGIIKPSINNPSCAYNVISVGAVDSTGSIWIPGTDSHPNKINEYSSIGPTYDKRIKPEIVAPGVLVTSHDMSDDLYSTATGTSHASPFVSGAAAILLEAKPEYAPLEIKTALLLGAT